MDYKKEVSRRSFLAFLGTGAAALAASATGLDPLLGKANASAAGHSAAALPFPALQPTTADKLTLAGGYTADWLATGEGGRYISFVQGKSVYEGYLWISHTDQKARGASILTIKRSDIDAAWTVEGTKSVSASDRISVTGPAKASGVTQGLWSNGSGGRTPWGTVLAGESPLDSGAAQAGINPESVGYIAEADPTDASFAVRKHTALGRFAHGDAVSALTRDRRVAIYMGSSRALFKFISAGEYDPVKGTANTALLEEGRLYAADFGSGQWIELTAKAVKAVLSNKTYRMPAGVDSLREDLLKKVEEQSNLLIYAQDAALVLGATPLDNPAGLALHPADGSLFVAQTGSASSGNGFGSVVRLVEDGSDAGSMTFESDLAAAGGRQAGFSSPDGAAFDSAGRLWLSSRIPSSLLNAGAYAAFGNNGLYALTSSGESFGKAEPFASAPVKGALSAPAFGPDGTLFAAIEGSGIVAIRRS